MRDNLSGCAVVGKPRNDYEFRVAGPDGLEPSPLDPLHPVPGVTTTGNQSWPSDPRAADEEAEEVRWQQKLESQGIQVGNRYPGR